MYDSNSGNLTVVEDTSLGTGAEVAPFSVVMDCDIGRESKIWRFVNMYGATLGENCMVGSFVEIQRDVVIGSRTRIQTHSFVCSKVAIGADVFVAHGVMFINDSEPPSGDADEWEETVVHDGAVIGSNATLMPVEIGENALVGAGAIVVDDVPENAIVAGNPAEIIGYRDN